MTPKKTEFQLWNLTYNDPGRWNEVESISGKRFSAWQGILQTLKGQPLGSIPTVLLGCSGLPSFEALLTSPSSRKGLNFERTTEGVIAFFKVRLELYGIPFRRGEWVFQELINPSERTVTPTQLTFRRAEEELTFHIEATDSQKLQLQNWLRESLTL